MNCVFIIPAHLNNQQIEQQYLLMIAMLNFDFEVHIIFDQASWHHWYSHKPLAQKLKALNLYGAEHSVLNGHQQGMDNEHIDVRHIDDNEYHQIMSGAGFIS